MKLRLTPRATENLVEIADYFLDRNPAAGLSVRDAIYETLQVLILFPNAGRLQTVGQVRKLATRRYAYLIYYAVDEVAEEIIVLNVKHPARDRGFEDA
jgi:toxin ParE1/3/4